MSAIRCALLLMLIYLPCALAGEPASPPLAEVIAPRSDDELDELEEVVVYGTDGELIAGVGAESELDEAGIAAYGANTVGDLLAQVAPDVDNSGEGPVILIDGKPAIGIQSVNDLPPEAIARIQVLQAQAAAAIGENPTRRVINVVMKPQFRQTVANVDTRAATAGRGISTSGNLGFVSLNEGRMRNYALRASRTQPLLESHRDIVSQQPGVPYDLFGNVVAYPATGGDIDPGFSALAGQPVTVIGVPLGLAEPSVEDFLQRANLANTSDMGRYRTLVAEQVTVGLNLNWSQQIAKTSFSFNLNADTGKSRSLTGGAPLLLRLPESSPYSPFGRDVQIARYVGEPLEQDRDTNNVNFSVNANRQLGKWRLQTNGNFTWRSSPTLSERRYDTSTLQAAVLDGSFNPFNVIPSELLGEALTDRARSRGTNASLLMQANGALFDLPAGKANASVRMEWRQSRQRSSTVGTSNVSSNRRREDQLAAVSVQLPLLGQVQSAASQNLSSDISVTTRKVSMTGTLLTHGYGLNWRIGSRVTLQARINQEKVAPQPEALSAPIVIVDGYRAYDFIREETVLVRYITGGNPDLGVEKRRVTRLGGSLRPFSKTDFTVNLEYQRTEGRDVLAMLPPVSEEVQAAFPDRYRRDAGGQLFEIDARQVSFTRSQNEVLRWGGNYRGNFGVSAPAAPLLTLGQIMVSNDGSELSGTGWRYTTNFTHSWQISSTRLARPGLEQVDLLSGAGYAGGQSRHTVTSQMGLAYNGTGLQLASNWKSRSRITAGTTAAPNNIVFSSYLLLNMTGFANLDTLFPGRPVLKGARVTLGIDNLLDARQRVTDQSGSTPLRYQPYLLNPLGRTAMLSLRKTL